MMKILFYTLLWVGAVYLFIRPSLKKTNVLTKGLSVMVLLASGGLWVLLRITVEIPRPADWLNLLLSPFVPVP